MTDVTLRATKGSPLTHTEMDNNQVATRSGRKNMIIGGNFDTNPWQRGTSHTSVINGQYTADRFLWETIGTAVVDHHKIADSPSVAQAGFKASHMLRITVTTADAAVAATDKYSVLYKMEGYDWAQVAQNDFVISFWHKHTKTGTYCVAISSQPTPDRSYVAEYTQSVSDTWEKAEIKVTASPSAGTWNYTNGVGIQIKFSMGTGTNFHTTADAWNTGNFSSTSSQVNALDSTSNVCRLALIQVEEGIVATDFERRAVGEELALCQRYYSEMVSGPNAQAIGMVYRAASNLAGVGLDVPQPMRAVPTVAQSGAFNIHGNGSVIALTGTIATIQALNQHISFRKTATGIAASNAYVIVPSTDDGFTFEAEL